MWRLGWMRRRLLQNALKARLLTPNCQSCVGGRVSRLLSRRSQVLKIVWHSCSKMLKASQMLDIGCYREYIMEVGACERALEGGDKFGAREKGDRSWWERGPCRLCGKWWGVRNTKIFQGGYRGDSSSKSEGCVEEHGRMPDIPMPGGNILWDNCQTSL